MAEGEREKKMELSLVEVDTKQDDWGKEKEW
jgi:hypothetical protein